MKKIRVYNIIRISFAILTIIFILSIVISITGVLNLPWIVASINMSSILIALASSSGIISKYDFYKRFDGEIIDEYEVVTWTNIIKTRWIVLFVVQLTFIFLNHLLIEYLALPFVEGWSLGKEHTVPLSFKLFLTLSPSIIFVLGSFIRRINKSEEELLKLKRRDRIRTSDISELKFKVDLEEWIKADALLQRDKDLFCKMAEIRLAYIDLFDDSLKCNKEFILSLPAINYSILNWVSHANIEFDENDFSDELIIKIIEQSDEYFHLRGDSEFAKIYTKKIIELYTNWYKQNKGARPGSIMNVFYSLKNVLKIHNSEIHKFPTLEKYKVCLEDEHIVEKDMDKCPYCIV
jgi:hypothetical protein